MLGSFAAFASGLPCSGRPSSEALSAPWSFAGPAGYRGLDHSDDDPTGMLSAGAAQAIVEGDPGTWYLASANGGVWRTNNVSAASPHWVPVTDAPSVACSSISALVAAPGGLVLAGCGGSTSSEMGADWNSLNDGDWAGVMKSTDGGETWQMLSSFPPNYYVSSIALLRGGAMLVGARSHFFNASDGGVWRSEDGGESFTRVLSQPVFNLLADTSSPSTVLAALPFPQPAEAAVLLSTDGGRTYAPLGAGIEFAQGHAPFYPTLALGGGSLYYGALTVSAADAVDTNSVVYRRPWPPSRDNDERAGGSWVAIPGGPDPAGHGLDDDAMPKDRMALLPHPHDASTLFVAGNGDKIAYRVNISGGGGGSGDGDGGGGGRSRSPLTAQWTSMVGSDAGNGAAPHCDCRNFGWDGASGALLLVSDGGIFRRTRPERAGGDWLSAIGDYGAMEFLSAAWDPHAHRWVAGAQDNDVQVSPPNASSSAVAAGIVLGDGMATAVDASVSPSRLWGTRQFLGSKRADVRRRQRARALREDTHDRDDDHDDDPDDYDDDHGDGDGDGDAMPGFCFVQGDATDLTRRVCLDTSAWGFTPEAFPFFMHPFALNALDQSVLVTWARAAAGEPAGFWQLRVPAHARAAADVPAPSFVASSAAADVYCLIAGGTVRGTPDPSLLLALNDTHLLVKSDVATAGRLLARRLPVRFARPLILRYDPTTHQPIIGPVSHGKTVSLAASRTDSLTLAVTGRPDVSTNGGDESVWLSRDGGVTWLNATGNLRAATQTVGQPRPSALLIVDLEAVGERHGTASALLVGTVSGVYVSFVGSGDAAPLGRWSRLGSCAELPLVLTLGLSHEPTSDTLVAATFGRGVYVMHHATRALRRARARMVGADGLVEGA